MDLISPSEKEKRKKEIKKKIDEVENKIWEVSLIDKFQEDDWKLYNKLHNDLSDLKKQLRNYDIIVDYDFNVYIKGFKLEELIGKDEIRLLDLINSYSCALYEIEKLKGVNK